MTEELLKQINEVIEGEDKPQESRAPISIVIGDGSTVVIGNGSINQEGGKQEEEEGDNRRRACNQGHHRELRRLRRKVRILKRLLTARGGVFKRPVTARRPVRTSSDPKLPARPVLQNVANHKRAALPRPPRATGPATAGFSAPQPTTTHVNSGFAHLMTAHSCG